MGLSDLTRQGMISAMIHYDHDFVICLEENTSGQCKCGDEFIQRQYSSDEVLFRTLCCYFGDWDPEDPYWAKMHDETFLQEVVEEAQRWLDWYPSSLQRGERCCCGVIHIS